MSQTIIASSSSLTVKRWSGALVVDVREKSYFERKFVSGGNNAVIQRLTELDQDAGDTIHFDLSVPLRGKPTIGDNRLQGNEESLRFYQDKVMIDQVRHAVSGGGKMTRKRTMHNIRNVAKDGLSSYFARWMDELAFIYLSGARGANLDFIEDLAYAGHAGNPIQAPDSDHILYPNNKTAANQIVATDTMTRKVIEEASLKARMMQTLNPEQSNMMPVSINGEEHYVMVMTPAQEYDLRVSDATGWLDVQRAASAAEGKNNPIFKGGLGMINNVVLHSHRSAIRFNDYGSSGDVKAARALFMGRQAGVVAYGAAGGLRFSWKEEMNDYENEPVISSGAIIGIKKTRFNNHDFGVLAVDTAAA